MVKCMEELFLCTFFSYNELDIINQKYIIITVFIAEFRHCGLVSGGFTFFADHLREKLNLTAAVANQLETFDGKFTGNVLGDIVDAQYKAKTLTELAEKYEIPLTQTIAIGDGANDLPMIKAAGLGIAYHAKPKVNEKAEVTIRHADLMGVFCILSASMSKK